MTNHWVFNIADGVRGRWAVLGFLGTVFLGLAPLKNSVVDPNFPDWAYRTCFWSAVALFAALLVSWALCLLGSHLERNVVEKFECASRDEIQEVLPFYDRVIGGGRRPSVNELKAMFAANKSIFRFYKRTSTRGARKTVEVKGFCTVIPMKRDAGILLEKGELNGLKMDGTHIAGPKERFDVYYIGSIGAEGSSAKAAVLNYVLALVDEFAQRGRGRVYTRPITEDGLRIVIKYGFVRTVDGEQPKMNELCFKDVGEERMAKRPPRVRRGASADLPEKAVAA